MTTLAIDSAASNAVPLVSSCENEQATLLPEPIPNAPALPALSDQAIWLPTSNEGAPGRVEEMRGHTVNVQMFAETVTDVERARIAAENRHRSWVQSGAAGTAAEQQAAEIVESLRKVEHDATLSVQRAVRQHPLGPFVKRTVGLGEKQAARLLAAVGDPYWNTYHDRPRTVSELWAYCGFHVVPHPGHHSADAHIRRAGVDPSRPSQSRFDPHVDNAGATPLHPGQGSDEAQSTVAGVDPSAVTGHRATGTHSSIARDGDPSCSPPSQGCDDSLTTSAWVAARRRKGHKANWSNEAKMRARLCAESCIKQAHSPYRPVYDASRAADAGKGLTPLHEHNRALRKVAKALLKDLWREARDWHTAEVDT